MSFQDEIKVNVKAYFSELGILTFKQDIRKLQRYIDKDVRYIIFKLFLQLGATEKDQKVFNYENKNEISLALQLKIKNYITFITKDGFENYIKNELDSEKELYLAYELEDGKIINI